MAKKFGAGVCIHCGMHTEKLTSDHILPDVVRGFGAAGARKMASALMFVLQLGVRKA